MYCSGSEGRAQQQQHYFTKYLFYYPLSIDQLDHAFSTNVQNVQNLTESKVIEQKVQLVGNLGIKHTIHRCLRGRTGFEVVCGVGGVRCGRIKVAVM